MPFIIGSPDNETALLRHGLVHYAVNGALIGDPILNVSNSFHDWSRPSIVSANPIAMGRGCYYSMTPTFQDPTHGPYFNENPVVQKS
jgi:hypothetical protein